MHEFGSTLETPEIGKMGGSWDFERGWKAADEALAGSCGQEGSAGDEGKPEALDGERFTLFLSLR